MGYNRWHFNRDCIKFHMYAYQTCSVHACCITAAFKHMLLQRTITEIGAAAAWPHDPQPIFDTENKSVWVGLPAVLLQT